MTALGMLLHFLVSALLRQEERRVARSWEPVSHSILVHACCSMSRRRSSDPFSLGEVGSKNMHKAREQTKVLRGVVRAQRMALYGP